MMNPVIASCLQNSKKQEITIEQIKKATNNIYAYVKEQQLKSFISVTPQNYDIKEAALSMNFSIQGNPMDKLKGEKAIINLKDNVGIL